MAAKIYSCKNCGFIFMRVGECDQCPDCGKYSVRLANEKEIKEFEYRKTHPDNDEFDVRNIAMDDSSKSST